MSIVPQVGVYEATLYAWVECAALVKVPHQEALLDIAGSNQRFINYNRKNFRTSQRATFATFVPYSASDMGNDSIPLISADKTINFPRSITWFRYPIQKDGIGAGLLQFELTIEPKTYGNAPYDPSKRSMWEPAKMTFTIQSEVGLKLIGKAIQLSLQYLHLRSDPNSLYARALVVVVRQLASVEVPDAAALIKLECEWPSTAKGFDYLWTAKCTFTRSRVSFIPLETHPNTRIQEGSPIAEESSAPVEVQGLGSHALYPRLLLSSPPQFNLV